VCDAEATLLADLDGGAKATLNKHWNGSSTPPGFGSLL
jgi:hypothetical protein